MMYLYVGMVLCAAQNKGKHLKDFTPILTYLATRLPSRNAVPIYRTSYSEHYRAQWDTKLLLLSMRQNALKVGINEITFMVLGNCQLFPLNKWLMGKYGDFVKSLLPSMSASSWKSPISPSLYTLHRYCVICVNI